MGTTVSDEGKALPGAELTRVLVVDDHRMFTELLAHLLDGYDDIELVGVATHGRRGAGLRGDRPAGRGGHRLPAPG